MAPGAQTAEQGDASKAYSLVAIPPQPFDKYVLIGKLGHGGMAEVNLAVSEGKGNFRKLVVIKRLHRHLAMEPGFIDMFLDEARLAARLNHPNCVQTYEVGEWDDNHFLAMEYLDGQGLERLLRISGQRDEPVPLDAAARIVSDALDGLAYAHELTDYDGRPLNVVHRDVSPQNIFVTYNGVVKLLDFGIAKAATHIVETRTGVIKGKYAYIAPEQGLGETIDHRADLWSMGVVLWEVLTGRRLFKSVNELATLQETLQGEIAPPSAFRTDVPPELDVICMRALTRDVSERYQSANEMKDELDRWLSDQPKPFGRKHIARLMRARFAAVIELHQKTLAQCLDGGAVQAGGVQPTIEPLTPSGASPAPRDLARIRVPPPAADPVLPPIVEESEAEARPDDNARVGSVVLVVLAMLGAVLAALMLPSEQPRGAESGAEQSSRGRARAGQATIESAPAGSREAPASGRLRIASASDHASLGSAAEPRSEGSFEPGAGRSEGAPGTATPRSELDGTSEGAAGAVREPGATRASPASGSEAAADPHASGSEGDARPAASTAAHDRTAGDRTSDERPEHHRARSTAVSAPPVGSRDLAPPSGPEPGEPPSPPPSDSSEPAPVETPAPASGYLTLATTPWARVHLGDRDLGTTPLIRVELPAGTHTLRLTNPEQNLEQTYRVTIPPGGTLTRRLGLR